MKTTNIYSGMININRVKDIPKDFYGVMGVPITFLHKLNLRQFRLLGSTNESIFGHNFKVDGRTLYTRLLIMRIDLTRLQNRQRLQCFYKKEKRYLRLRKGEIKDNGLLKLAKLS